MCSYVTDYFGGKHFQSGHNSFSKSLKLLKYGDSFSLFSYFENSFLIKLIANKIADLWIRILYQLRHNHCPHR